MKDAICHTKLPNGLTVCLRPTDLTAGLVYLTLSVKVGSLNDGANRGIAHLLEHCNMAFEKYRKPTPIFCYRARAYTDYYSTNYIYACKKEEIKMVFALLQKLILGNYLDAKAFSEIKQDVLAEYQKKQADADYCSLVRFFGNTAYATELPVGNPEIVRVFSFPEVMAFFHKWYVPERMALIAVGDLPADTEEEIRKLKFLCLKEDNRKGLEGENSALLSEQTGSDEKASDLGAAARGFMEAAPIREQSSSLHYFYTISRGMDGVDGMDISGGAAGFEQYLKIDFLYDFSSDVIAKAFESQKKYHLGKKGCQRSFFAPFKEMMYFTVTVTEQEEEAKCPREKDKKRDGGFQAQDIVDEKRLCREISSFVLSWLDANFEIMKEEYRAAFCYSENYISVKAMNQQCIEHYIYGRPLVDYLQENQVLSAYLDQIEKSTITKLVWSFLENSVVIGADC